MAKKKSNDFDFLDDAPDQVMTLDDAIATDEKVKKLSPFDFLKTINETKVNLIEKDSTVENQYHAFIVNKGLSFFGDTLFIANEMNANATILDKKMQYDFLLMVVPKGKRFSKWFKESPVENMIKYIMLDYECNRNRALEIAELLSQEQMDIIIKRHERVGIIKK